MELVTPSIGLIFWQTVIFALTLFLLGKFAWKPIMNGLKERENSISDALEAADKAREEMAKLNANNEALLAEARQEREKIMKDAENAAKLIKEEAQETAKNTAEKIMVDAKAQIEQEKNKALTSVKALAADFSLQIAEKVLRNNLKSDADQKALVDSYIKDLNNN